jgi:hypothetical protein
LNRPILPVAVAGRFQDSPIDVGFVAAVDNAGQSSSQSQ